MKKKVYIASVSFGKDSLAMLLKLLEQGKKIDMVLFYNSGMEFKAIYLLKEKVREVLKKYGIPLVEIRPKVPFLEKMFFSKVESKDGTIHYGSDWCGGACRWGTGEKISAIELYLQENFPKNEYDIYEYVGIAADEKNRIQKNNRKIYPLVTLGMTEDDCLSYCYEKGYFWQENGVELYSVLDRVSCWCCTNKNLAELRNIYLYLPEYWERLKGMQSRISRPFKSSGRTIFDLDEKFKQEESTWYFAYEVEYSNGEKEMFGIFGRCVSTNKKVFEKAGTKVVAVTPLNHKMRPIQRIVMV